MTLNCSLTFDFDATSLWIGSYKSRNPSMISRGEFGAVAMPRILDLLKKHGIGGTFFIPGHTALAYPDILKRVAAEGHEIGHHGWVHENPADFDEAGERFNIEKGLDCLYKAAGTVPKGYRSPAWDFSQRTAAMLVEYGFLYDSSMMGDDFTPYYARTGDVFDRVSPYKFGPNIDLVELPVTWVLDDFPHFEFVDGDTYGLSAPSKVEEIWTDEFTYARENARGGLFSLTMHPQVIGRGHRMMMLDRLITKFKQHEDVRFTTMLDYAQDWRRANPLSAWVNSGAPQAQPSCGRDAPWAAKTP